MKTKSKIVNFDYYQVYILESKNLLNREENLFNLMKWRIDADQLTYQERITDFGYDKITFNSHIYGDNYIFFHFNRMNDIDPPLKTKGMGDSKTVDLEDDEYLTNNVTALFDQRYCLLLLQRNKNGVGHSVLENYLNMIWNKISPNETIYLRPVLKPDAIERISKAETLSKIRLKFADVRPTLLNRGITSMIPFLKSIYRFDAIQAEVILTVDKYNSLNKEAVMETAYDISNNKSNIKIAEVSKRDAEDNQIETINLIQDKATVSTTFKLKSKKSLTSKEVRDCMLELYEEDSHKILPYLNRIERR